MSDRTVSYIKLFCCFAIVFAVVNAFCNISGTKEGFPDYTIRIIADTFNPSVLNVLTGSTVSWRNYDVRPHTIISIPNKQCEIFRTRMVVKPGGTYEYTFDEPGTFEYYDSYFPSMKGKIVVIPWNNHNKIFDQ